MKTLQEANDFLKDLALKMNLQDNQGTQFPGWVVVDGVGDGELFDPLHVGVFLTREACQMHIKKNDYHYSNPHTYCIGNWRNSEIQEVMKAIFILAGIEAPSHYK